MSAPACNFSLYQSASRGGDAGQRQLVKEKKPELGASRREASGGGALDLIGSRAQDLELRVRGPPASICKLGFVGDGLVSLSKGSVSTYGVCQRYMPWRMQVEVRLLFGPLTRSSSRLGSLPPFQAPECLPGCLREGHHASCN